MQTRQTRQGASYFITFNDDFTHFSHVYLISHTSKAISCFKKYVNLVENQLDKKVKALNTNRVREYLSTLFNEYRDEKGIVS